MGVLHQGGNQGAHQSGKGAAPAAASTASAVSTTGGTPGASAARPSTKQLGDAAEDAALRHLQAAGLRLVARNYRTPGRGGGEIDLVMQDPRDATLVFVEVRARRSERHGGAGGSITGPKQRRIVFAARHFIARLRTPPPCRFDVVLVSPGRPPEWLQAAFDAG